MNTSESNNINIDDLSEPVTSNTESTSDKYRHDYSATFQNIEEWAVKNNVSPEVLWWLIKTGAELFNNISNLFLKSK